MTIDKTKKFYTCPCCGYNTLSDTPGSYDICHVCFWEDDPVQVLDPWFSGGANKPSLIEAQSNYARVGACDENGKQFVDGILPGDERDPEWRPVTEADRLHVRTPRDISDENNNINVWYYWKN